MNKFQNVNFTILALAAGTFLLQGCGSPEADNASNQAINSSYEIAADEYGDLAERALNYYADLDFDTWGEMLADDVDYYFPDGDGEERTILRGKEEVLDWFNTWKETSGIEQMTINESVHFPIIAKEELNYSELRDVLVISYFSNAMIYNGTPVNIRMNYVTFINDENLIYRYYSYYDRTEIIHAMNENILETGTN